ncbi:MAG: IclR family transcriptional regulator [Anaerolineales bacterium]
MNDDNLKYLSKSVQIAIDVLLAFTDKEPDKGITELSVALGTPKSAIHRAVINLQMRDLLQRDPATQKYRLGLRVFELGMRARLRMNIGQIARPFLKELVHQTELSASLAVLSQGQALFLDAVESPRGLRAVVAVGQSRPIHCSSMGKALVAWLPEFKVRQILEQTGLTPYTQHTITDPQQFLEALRIVRERGYALDLEEYEENLFCIGVPVRASTGDVVAAISISGPKYQPDSAFDPSLIRCALSAAEAVSYAIRGLDTNFR